VKQIEISFPINSINSEVKLSSSKSESNRALIIKALSNNPIELSNLSDARDTQTMQSLIYNSPEAWDVLDAGTTMRFCTAYLSLGAKNKVITGSARMKERPIGVLVDSLNKLGADIKYIEREGFPPLRINRIEHQKTDSIKIPGNISSQYISALLMIAPKLPLGLKIEFTSDVFSKPYILMTLELMKRFGVESAWRENVIEVKKQEYSGGQYEIESDWSGASYWYSLISMAKDSELSVKGLRKNSFQGDSAIAAIMNKMGVSTIFEENKTFIKSNDTAQSTLDLDFKACPDLAQTVMVSAAVNGIKLKMTGLERLKINET
jgi:3-phosphoshikimate 1-carboxyvinyltransferase